MENQLAHPEIPSAIELQTPETDVWLGQVTPIQNLRVETQKYPGHIQRGQTFGKLRASTGLHNKGLHGWLQIDGPDEDGLRHLLPNFEFQECVNANRRHQCLLGRAHRYRSSPKAYLQS
ncbi:hypothetical protein OUZ56_025432 [Daphnia magna]|uniref:Uncharacterized protein n=1 Tax=Daphnia magna TaxID=35525 RepID=A0ABQ9ZJU5_9CRUS|nr:hypothetical protein OUZ56_025432 [Daphnia magna]